MGLELKRSNKVFASRLQAHTLKLINNAGGAGVVVHPDNWPQVLEALKAISQGSRYDRSAMERLKGL